MRPVYVDLMFVIPPKNFGSSREKLQPKERMGAVLGKYRHLLGMAAKPPSCRRLFGVVMSGCQGTASSPTWEFIQKRLHPSLAFGALANIPAIQEEQQFRHVFSFYGISSVCFIPQFMDQLQVLCFFTVAEVTGKTDAAASFREYVLQECIDKIRAAQVHLLCLTIVCVIFVMEGYPTGINGINTAVADRTPENITGKILDRISETIECFLDMWDPCLIVKFIKERLPFIEVAELLAITGKDEFSAIVVLFQGSKKFSTEKSSHCLFRQYVALVCRLNEPAGWGQAAAGQHGVDMRMIVQLLSLRVQYGYDSRGCPKVFGVPAKVEERIRGASEHEGI